MLQETPKLNTSANNRMIAGGVSSIAIISIISIIAQVIPAINYD